MGSHSIISPSSSGRVTKCPASLLASLFAPRTSSAAADRGTEFHNQAERILNSYKESGCLPELPFEIEAYVKNCVTLIEKSSWYWVEARVPLDKLSPIGGQFGTADFVALVGRTLYVNDLKTGTGIVSPFNNSQLSHYGLGALQFVEDQIGAGLVDDFMLGISQGDVVEYEPVSMKSMMARCEQYAAAYKSALSLNAPYQMGNHCKYCPAKATCPEQNSAMREAVTPRQLELTELVEVYKNKKQYTEYLDSVESRLLMEAEAGHPVAGTCLKPGIVRRTWSDTATVIALLQANRSDWANFVKPAGIAELTKIMPELAAYTIKPEPKMVLALEKPDGK